MAEAAPCVLASAFRNDDQASASPLEDQEEKTKAEENALREQRLTEWADDVIYDLLNPFV